MTAATELRRAESFLRSYNLFQNITAAYHEIETDVRQCGEARGNIIWQYGGSIFFSDGKARGNVIWQYGGSIFFSDTSYSSHLEVLPFPKLS